jgi:hypothetical protein
MRTHTPFASLFLGAALVAAGCSNGVEQRTLAGRVDTTALRLDNAQVIAVAASGRTFRAPIDKSGAFSIALPVAATYTIRFANGTTDPTRFDAFGTLVVTSAGGARSRYLTLTSGPTIALGRVSIAGTTTSSPTSGSGLGTASDSGSSSDDDGRSSSEDHADDSGHEDDDAEVCDLSGGKDDVELEAEHDPGHDCDADHDGKMDADDDHDDRQACASKNDDDCAHSDAQEQELDDDHDAPCATSTAGATPPAASPALL